MKKKISIIINITIFVLSIFTLITALIGLGFRGMVNQPLEFGYLMKYFTVLSNLFMGFVALAFAINEILYIKKNIEIKKYMYILKLMATVSVAITFLTVVFFLAPKEKNYFSLFYDGNFFYHFFIPVISIITFILLDNTNKLSIKSTIFGILPFVVYTIFYIIVSLANMDGASFKDGYDWYGFLGLGPWFILAAILMLGGAYAISFLLYFSNKKLYKEN